MDAASLAYRAYHAIPALTAPDGTKINATLGFLNFLGRLIQDRGPARMTIALDADWRPAFRVEALPTYKAHRVAADGDDVDQDELGPQVAILLDIVDAIGISVAEAEGFEAEDVIATLAKRARRDVEVVTGDRDLFALVADPKVRILYTLRGVSELAKVDAAWIESKYGIPGDRYVDFAILRGDPSDGLPGVAGIGEKTAAQLLRRYGSLEGILSARDLPAGVRERLLASADYLVAAVRVVAPRANAPVVGGDGTLPRAPAHPRRLSQLAQRYKLSGAIDRLVAALARLASERVGQR